MIGVIAGHNKTAVGSYCYNMDEYDINTKIAKGIYDKLKGKAVYIDRGEELDAYIKLPNKINNSKCRIAIEIHTGADEDCRTTGCEAYYKAGDNFSKHLAKAINLITHKSTGIAIRGSHQVKETGRGAYIINTPKAKVLIIKPFYLSSRKDYNSLFKNFDDYCTKVASILEQAIDQIGGAK